MSSLLTAGMIRLWTLTESITTRATSRKIFDSFLGKSTKVTEGLSRICKNGFRRSSFVYDIAYAGPRNRFTIKTRSGHLIVHNCGYGGWITSSRAFGHTGTDAEIQEQILQWRKDSPTIPFLWGGQTAIPSIVGWHQRAVAHGLVPLEGPQWEHARAMNADAKPWDRTRMPYLHGCEGMFIKAMQNPGVECHVHRLDGSATGIYYVKVGDAVHAVWLDGTSIVYHRPRLQPNKDDWRGLQISYEGWNTNPKNGPVNQWIRMPTHGGRLVENEDQQVSNRIQRFSQINLERAGYPIVQHVYDENCSEIPQAFGSVEEFCEVMNRMPTWASTRGRPWPVRAPVKDAWRGRRYRK